MDIKTCCIHGNKKEKNSKGAISTPIYQSATFEHISAFQSSGYDYSRLSNPTRDCIEKRINDLEKAFDTVAFATGMAATTALMNLFKSGDHIIATDDLYGGSIRLFDNILSRNKISVTYVNTSNLELITQNINSNTSAIFIETPTNPMMHVSDISEISKIAKKHNLLLIVDNTFLSPYFCNPIPLGADIVMHSGTKFICGHNDTLAGFLSVSTEQLSQQIRYIAKTIGACLSPFDSWLTLRGIKTLALRMEASQKSAIKIAEFLQTIPEITTVNYIGLKSHPNYETNLKQSRGFGSMISFSVNAEETAVKILNGLKLISYAESLGGVESLITYPMHQTHADVPKEDREKRGINEKLLRLSVGCEDVDDLINDLKNVLS